MGYRKSGSQKSLAAGGISALVLYLVHTQLPVRPVFASSISLGTQSFFWSFGPFLCLAVLWTWIFHLTSFWFCILGISAALLSVMGSRFKKSGKIFPAGVVSLVSLVMVGGYFHGILRSSVSITQSAPRIGITIKFYVSSALGTLCCFKFRWTLSLFGGCFKCS